ncbi:MAG: hypothetical protein V1848_01280 [Candidatus Magasanikbacteria bacterium]
MYARGIYSLEEQSLFLGRTTANTAEIHLSSWGREDERMRSLNVKKRFAVNYVSLHLPGVTREIDEQMLTTARYAIACCEATVVVTHPMKLDGNYPTEQYRQLLDGGVPLALENMDIRKADGFLIDDLEKLMSDVGCRLVLDVQHAYEHDPAMGYAKDLFETCQDSLAHLHVSGQTPDNIHSLVYRADNAREIVDFVGRILSVQDIPLILEGEYTSSEELQKEIDFLTRELC